MGAQEAGLRENQASVIELKTALAEILIAVLGGGEIATMGNSLAKKLTSKITKVRDKPR